MNSPTSKSVGPNPNSSSASGEVCVEVDRALTSTPLDCSSWVSSTLFQKVGISVENSVVGVASASPDG